jgi:hypothetical protein
MFSEIRAQPCARALSLCIAEVGDWWKTGIGMRDVMLLAQLNLVYVQS